MSWSAVCSEETPISMLALPINYSPRNTSPHCSIISCSVIVIERIFILQEQSKIKPLTVKNLLQSGDNRTNKVLPCYIPCNWHTGEWVNDIPLRALPTSCGNSPVERQSLVNLLTWNRCAIVDGHIEMNGVKGRLLNERTQVLTWNIIG